MCHVCNGSGRSPLTPGLSCPMCDGVGLSPAVFPTADNALMAIAFEYCTRAVEAIQSLPRSHATLLASRLHEHANLMGIHDGEAMKSIFRALAHYAEVANP